MKRMLRFEFSRAFASRGFYAALLMGCGISLADIYLFRYYFHSELETKTVIQTWIGSDYQFVTNGLFYVLLPLLAALPYAASYYDDLKSGYVKNILTQVSRKTYYTAKVVVTSVMAALGVMIPLVADLMTVMALYPARQAERLEFLAINIVDKYRFSGLYEANGVLYALAYILLDSVVAGILALVCICVAEHVESRFGALLAPFTVYVMWSVVMMENCDGKYALMELVNPLQRYFFQALELGQMLAACTLAVTVWILCKGRRKDVL